MSPRPGSRAASSRKKLQLVFDLLDGSRSASGDSLAGFLTRFGRIGAGQKDEWRNFLRPPEELLSTKARLEDLPLPVFPARWTDGAAELRQAMRGLDPSAATGIV
jgi:hypothetical protein